MQNNNAGSNGIGFFGLLGIAFIVMKCLNQITWSWVWVLAPLWMPMLVTILVLFGAFVFSVIKVLLKRKSEDLDNEKEE